MDSYLIEMELPEGAEFLLERQLTDSHVNLLGDPLVVRIDVQHHILHNNDVVSSLAGSVTLWYGSRSLDSYFLLTDLDADPEGRKTYGSGCESGSGKLVY
jgi:hypothetical protein